MKGSRQARQTKSRKKIAASICLALLAIAVMFIFKIAGAPAEGSIKQTADTVSAGQAPASLQRMLPVRARYMTFAYPANFNRATTEPVAGTQLENFSFTKTQMPFWNLNVQISRLPSGNVMDDASYHLRADSPAVYKKEVVAARSIPAYVFSDASQGFSKVAFSPHNGLLMTISLTSYDVQNSEKLQQAFESVLNSMEWH